MSRLEFVIDCRAPGVLVHPGDTLFKQSRTKSNSSWSAQSGCASRSMLLYSELDLGWPAALFCYFLVRSLSCFDSFSASTLLPLCWALGLFTDSSLHWRWAENTQNIKWIFSTLIQSCVEGEKRENEMVRETRIAKQEMWSSTIHQLQVHCGKTLKEFAVM